MQFVDQIKDSQSLFTYPTGLGTTNYTDPAYTPIFSENIQQLFGENQQLYQQALQSCGNDVSCLYDAALTLDLQAAVSGKDVATQYQETTTQLGRIHIQDLDFRFKSETVY